MSFCSRCTCTTSTPSTPSSSSSASSSTSLSSSSLSSSLTGPLPLLGNVSKLAARFLNYSFLGYGYGVWRYYSLPHEERRSQAFCALVVNSPNPRFLDFNPMCEVFPRVASCDYKRLISSAAPQRHRHQRFLSSDMVLVVLVLVEL